MTNAKLKEIAATKKKYPLPLRIAGFVLTVVLLFTVVAIPTILLVRFFESLERDELIVGLEYELNDTDADNVYYEIIGYNALIEADLDYISIPDTYRGYPVKAIKDGALADCQIKYLSIGANIISIGEGILKGNTSIVYLSVPYLGSNIDDEQNSYLGYLFGSDKPTMDTIDDGAGKAPESLQDVYVTTAKYIGELAFAGNPSLSYIAIRSNLRLVPADGFVSGNGITSYTAVEALEYIGFGAFYGCTRFTVLELPFVGYDGKGIENSHFGYIFGAPDAASNPLYVPESLSYVSINSTYAGGVIADEAFLGCGNIHYIDIQSAKEIGFAAFKDCTALQRITLPFIGASISDDETNTHFGYIFGASDYTENEQYTPASLLGVKISATPKIDAYAFYGCANITTFYIYGTYYPGKGLDFVVGDYAFANCTAAKVIMIDVYGEFGNLLVSSNTCLHLNSFVFDGCISIKQVYLYSGKLKVPGTKPFNGFTSTQTISISVAEIIDPDGNFYDNNDAEIVKNITHMIFLFPIYTLQTN
ncbi:MAG: leucine-rich repeat domain-containing protein [Clostridiales bacterium]|jgi:hypothetical protein|nr:leucine-rich repeat domain-containing protein [Clostridiales bacterium]